MRESRNNHAVTPIRLAGRLPLILAAVFALASFLLHYSLERRLDRLQAFDQYNVIFQADPNERIGAMSHGWGDSGRNVAHPNLAVFTSPFVRVAAAVAVRAGLADDEEALRRSIGMLIVPFASAVTAVVLFALFLRLGLSLVLASLFTTLGLVSFSAVVFGSIPDHFALSVPVIAAAYHLFLSRTGGRAGGLAWFIVMFVAAGITITNLAIIAILRLGSMWNDGRARARSALQVAAMAVGVTILTYATSVAFNQAVHGESVSARQSTSWTTTFINRDALARAVRFPLAIANTIAPAKISTGAPTSSFRPDDRYQFRFTFEERTGRPTLRSLLGVIALALVAAGVVASVKRRVPFSSVGIASAAVIAFNWILHSAWGDETFLYSQHWFISTLILIALSISAMDRRWRFTPVVVGVFVLAVAANSYALVRTMLALLHSNVG